MVILSLAVPATLLFTTAPVFATLPSSPGPGSGSTSSAKCAVLDQGAVSCPPEITGNKSYDGKCFYEDPGNPSVPGEVKGTDFYPYSCNSDVFKNDNCVGALSNQPKSCNVNAFQDPALKCTQSSCDLVKKYINPLIATLAGAVGLVVTISIVLGSIQYSSASGDPQKAAAAKGRIQNALIALIGFFLLFALLSWLIPGGIFHG